MARFLNPNNILAFVTVAREGSVSRAAEILHLTQPATRHQIRRLGEETGITLFKGTPHGLDLTADGETLPPKAEQGLSADTPIMTALYDQLEAVWQSWSKGPLLRSNGCARKVTLVVGFP